MSYSIHVYPIALQEKTASENLDFDAVFDFIEDKQNLIPFSEEQDELIHDHLSYRGFKLDRESADRNDYSHPRFESLSVIVTSTGAYFNGRGDDVLDMTMTALEFGRSGELKGKFGIFDPGNGGWQ